jgi:AraC-like DNA-binding protein
MRRIGREGGYFGTIERRGEVGGLVLATTTYRGPISIPRHDHEYPSLFLSLRGEFLSTHAGEDRLMRAGEAAYYPPLEPHAVAIGGMPAAGFNIEVTPECGLWQVLSTGEPGLALPRGNGTRTLPALLCELHREFLTADESTPDAVEAICILLATSVQRDRKRQKHRFAPPRWLDIVYEALRAPAAHPPRTHELAKLAGVHSAELLREFRRHTGCTPTVYARRLKLRAAAQLLLETNLSIGEIAIQTKFYDQSHFCRVFRQATGETPSSFRERQLRK